MFVAQHVGTATRTGTQLSGKINVVPQAGALTVSPVTVATIVNVTEGNCMHNETIF